MKRTSFCIALFTFAILADAVHGPITPAMALLEETPTAALALGPVAVLVYRLFAHKESKLQ
jgi:hypothetical protein